MGNVSSSTGCIASSYSNPRISHSRCWYYRGRTLKIQFLYWQKIKLTAVIGRGDDIITSTTSQGTFLSHQKEIMGPVTVLLHPGTIWIQIVAFWNQFLNLKGGKGPGTGVVVLSLEKRRKSEEEGENPATVEHFLGWERGSADLPHSKAYKHFLVNYLISHRRGRQNPEANPLFPSFSSSHESRQLLISVFWF